MSNINSTSALQQMLKQIKEMGGGAVNCTEPGAGFAFGLMVIESLDGV